MSIRFEWKANNKSNGEIVFHAISDTNYGNAKKFVKKIKMLAGLYEPNMEISLCLVEDDKTVLWEKL